jgi:hypothetical protein
MLSFANYQHKVMIQEKVSKAAEDSFLFAIRVSPRIHSE